jgi:hypothetical protein
VQHRSAYPLRLVRALLANGPIGAKAKGQQARQLLNAVEALYSLPSEERMGGGSGAAAAASHAIAAGVAAATGLSLH